MSQLVLGKNEAECEYGARAAPRRRVAHYGLTPHRGLCLLGRKRVGAPTSEPLQLSGVVPVA